MITNHVKLVMDKTEIGRGEVFLNGKSLPGVTDVEIVVSVGQITKVKLTLDSQIEVIKSPSEEANRNARNFNVHQTKCASDMAEAGQKTGNHGESDN